MIQSGVPLKVRLFSLDLCGVVITPSDMQAAAAAAGLKLPKKNTESLYDALLHQASEATQREAWLHALAAIIRQKSEKMRETNAPDPASAALLKKQCALALLTAIYLENEAADELA